MTKKNTTICPRCHMVHTRKQFCRVNKPGVNRPVPQIELCKHISFENIAMELRRAGYTMVAVSLALGKDRGWLGFRLRGDKQWVEYHDAVNLFELVFRVLPEETCKKILPEHFLKYKGIDIQSLKKDYTA